MDDEDRPKLRGDTASQLASESLDSYSLDELDARIRFLEEEIARISAHRSKASAHMLAADALFRPRAS